MLYMCKHRVFHFILYRAAEFWSLGIRKFTGNCFYMKVLLSVFSWCLMKDVFAQLRRYRRLSCARSNTEFFGFLFIVFYSFDMSYIRSGSYYFIVQIPMQHLKAFLIWFDTRRLSIIKRCLCSVFMRM